MMKYFLLSLLGLHFFTSTSFSQSEQSGPILWTARWSKDGNQIAVGGNDGILRLFDGKTFESIKHESSRIFSGYLMFTKVITMPHEIERKFLLEKLPEATRDGLVLPIVQGYPALEPEG